MTNKQNAIGVVVGRFQVHKLTEGHKEILDLVYENGKLIREQTFSEIRKIVRENWT